MKLWGQKSETENQSPVGGSFEEAAARVTAEQPFDPMREVLEEGKTEAGEDTLLIRPDWAEGVARLCFFPAARLSHPAYALTEEEAEIISPKMQAFLQAVADKYAPTALGRVANKYPEFFDLTAALGVLYWQKWRYVSKLRQMEAAERAEREASEQAGRPVAVESLPPRPKVGERTADGALVI
jgi:hypothetical protein